MKDASDEEGMNPEMPLRHRSKIDAIGRLASGVAHDLNNMLTSIRGLSTLAMRELEPDHPLQADLEQIDNAAQRAADLTRLLSGLSPRRAQKPVAIDLNAVLGSFEWILRRVLTEQPELRTSYEPELPTVIADAGQLQRLILSFAVFSDDSRSEPGPIEVHTSVEVVPAGEAIATPGRYAVVRVDVPGVELAAADLAAALEPFVTFAHPEPEAAGQTLLTGDLIGGGGLVQVALGPDVATLRLHLPFSAPG